MAAEPVAILRVKTPGMVEKEIPLVDGQTIAVGRDAKNELPLEDSAVSRIHACFTATTHGVILADLSSRNGTFLNGERIASFRDLMSGDIIDIGSTKIVINLNNSDVMTAVTPTCSARSMTTELRPVSVTVLVVSIVDYPKVWKTLPTEKAEEMVKSWRENVKDIVEALGGSVDKAIDRSVVAMWIGYEAKQQANSAATAGMQIRKMTATFAKRAEWGTHNLDELDCTVVLASGAALENSANAQNKGSLRGITLLGDPINIAFRLEESIAKLGQRMIIHKATADLIGSQMPLRRIIGMRLREGEAPVDIFVPA